ncbi:MAG TPA: hypothetical protein DCW60_00140 [Sutterella sp.]|nr:hypothetical protein [Sutterella sp.]
MLDYVIRKKALELFNSGVGYKTVSRELGLPFYTAREWVRRYKRGEIEFFDKDYIVPAYRSYKPSVVKAVLEGYKKGEPIKSLSRQFGMSPQTVKKWVIEAQKRESLPESVEPQSVENNA